MAPGRAFVIGFVRTPPSAKALHPLVSDPMRFQRGAERLGAELRVAPRTWTAPDVDHCFDAVRMKKAQEIRKLERGVADRPDLTVRSSGLDCSPGLVGCSHQSPSAWLR